MAYAEFPAVNAYDYDLREILEMYKKVTSEYNGLVEDIANLKTAFADYQNQINNSLTPAIQQAVNNANIQYLTKITMLERQLAQYKNVTDTLLNMETKDRIKADSALCTSITTLEDKMEECAQSLITLINSHQTEYKQLIESTKVYLMGRDAGYWSKVLDITQDLQNQIKSIPENTEYVVNPVTGKMDTAGNTIRDIWNIVLQQGGFSCLEFKNASYVTCEYWNNSGIDCIEWWTQGKTKLNWYFPAGHVWSGISGKTVTLQTAIYELYDLAKNGNSKAGMAAITAAEYDEKEISAEQFGAQNLKGYCYDWFGKELLKDVHGENEELQPTPVEGE